MTSVRLQNHTFFRRYENIGYIYSQASHKDMVLDEIGAEFLDVVNRHAVSIDDAVNRLSRKFPDVRKQKLEKDFITFIVPLRNEGFVSLVGTDKLEAKHEVSLSCSTLRDGNDAIARQRLEDTRDYLLAHFKKYPRPFRAHIEITSQCNLDCVHCYLSDKAGQTLSRESVCSFLDQLKLMGTLEVVFTGGEPFLHKDVVPLLSYARQKDFSVILLTNGTLLGSDVVHSLKGLDLALVQISLYSMDSVVHDEITKSVGSWIRTFDAIEFLVANDVRVEIACPAMKENIDTYHQVIEYGEKKGIPVSVDLAIMAKDDFSHDSLDHRITVSGIQNVVRNRNRADGNHKVDHESSRNCRPDDPICGMGISLICLAGDGSYYPCPGFRMAFGNIRTDSVCDVWNSSPEITTLRTISNSSFPKCMSCDSLDFCTICPAKFYNESGGDMFKIAEYYCEIARAEKELSEAY